ncbi:hypothetical protein [Streptomyces canus]|nr:hypothetical protein [Streptomyces canus]
MPATPEPMVTPTLAAELPGAEPAKRMTSVLAAASRRPVRT